MTAPRLYLDEDVDPLLARILADRGFDVLTTRDARRIAARDEDQLAFAAREGRAILTHNVAHLLLSPASMAALASNTTVWFSRSSSP